MKAIFPYAVMLGLFLAGNKLVERQQQYNLTNQVAIPAKPALLIGSFSADPSDSSMQLSSKPAKVINPSSGK